MPPIAPAHHAFDTIAWVLIHSCWQGLLVWMIFRVARRLTNDAATRCQIGNVCLIVFIAAQVATTFYVTREGGDGAALFSGWFGTANQAFELDASGQIRLPQVPMSAAVARWVAAAEPYLPWLAAAWLVCVALQFARAAGALLFLRREVDRCIELTDATRQQFAHLARRLPVRRSVNYLECRAISTLGTAGWLRPVVLVPSSALLQIPPQQLEALVLHELAHICRDDYATHLLRSFIDAAYFFHPLVRAICRSVSNDAEQATDDLAAHALGDPKVYAESLIALEEQRVRQLMLGADGGSLRDRVLRLVRRRRDPELYLRRRAGVSLGGSVLASLLGLLIFGQAVSWAAEQRREVGWVMERDLAEAVVATCATPAPGTAAPVPHPQLLPTLRAALDELKPGSGLSPATLDRVADVVCLGVPPDLIYTDVSNRQRPGDYTRLALFDSPTVGNRSQRQAIIEQLATSALNHPDRARQRVHARAALILSSLELVYDNGRLARMLLRQTDLVRRMDLSSVAHRRLQLAMSVQWARGSEAAPLLTKVVRSPRPPTAEEMAAVARDLPYLPSLQVTACVVGAPAFKAELARLLESDPDRYPPARVAYVLRMANLPVSRTPRGNGGDRPVQLGPP